MSSVAHEYGIGVSLLFKWRSLEKSDGLIAIKENEPAVPASKYAEALDEIKRLQRLLGEKTANIDIHKDAVEILRAKKVACALELIGKGHKTSRVRALLSLARSHICKLLKRRTDRKDGRKARNKDAKRRSDAPAIGEIKEAIDLHPTFGYRRITAVVNRNRRKQKRDPVNHKRIYRIVKENCLLTCTKMNMPADPREQNGHIAVGDSDRRWCSDALELGCLNGKKVSMTFVLDCYDRELISFVAHKGKEGASWMAQEQVLLAVTKRFDETGSVPEGLQLLTDNGSAYTAKGRRSLLRTLGIEDCKTPVSSPQSNGMAESFVKTLKCDYLPFIGLTSDETALMDLPQMVARYNYEHPHSALGYLSPAEYRASKGLQAPVDMQDYMPIHDIPGCVIVWPSTGKHCEERA